MISIYSCKDYRAHHRVRTPAEADRILRGPSIHEGYGMFAMEAGHPGIVGTETEGYTGHRPETPTGAELGGSVLTGREHGDG